MNSQRLGLVLAGSVAVATIAFASSLAPVSPLPWLAGTGLLLATYAAGLGIGRLAWKRGG